MKKFILFLVTMLFVFIVTFWFTGGKKIIATFDDNKTYEFVSERMISYKSLDSSKLFCNGILTYNNQKITYLDYNNNIMWENRNRVFIDSVFIDENYIYKCFENSMEIINKNNQNYVVAEIQGKIINVSRENNKIFIISKQNSGKNLLYILNDNNEVIVENKQYDESITGVTINGKAESYCVSTIKYTGGIIKNTISYNLIEDVELWNETIEDEIVIKVEISNNNIIVLGTENIYCFNINGSLMWKNSNYNKVNDYEINEKQERIYILYDEDEKTEILAYNFKGKVKEIYKLPKNTKKIKIINNKLFIYNNNSISIAHDGIVNKLFDEGNSQIIDFNVKNNEMYILLEDNLIIGKLK
ncbi:hypothetical protein J2Z76_002146 [Sedimentibacter acidaminivorans]|uniref:Uncharacterized protein n=1 Tax=Sedimentibacter acidaminivorans TaxID=913099 RepID=A0ABS4GF10_9FIRM|nr:DUF5711 family protein [Sedimentibacter acidaminivorans]MBP1926281.1 hypothetical protein [Sedimentibacter acidaminivorans]